MVHFHFVALAPMFQDTAYDWQYTTEPQKHAPLKAFKGGRSKWARGKGLGGSSLLNYMAYVRGHPKDFDEWASLGAEGWSYKDVLPVFKKSERYHDSEDFNPTYHNDKGQLGVRTYSKEHSVGYSAILDSALSEMGLKYGDYNGKDQNVKYKFQNTQNSGKRADTYSTFADHWVGKGLKVLTYAHATKLNLDRVGKVTKGIKVERFGQELDLFAHKEVIVSAGAIGSPQLLMLSGIGPKKHLEDIGIQTAHDLPGVGSNLQDHLLTPFEFINTAEETSWLGSSLYTAVNPMNYWMYFFGPLPGPLGEFGDGPTGAFVHSVGNKDTYGRPDIQILNLPSLFYMDYGTNMKEGFGLSDETITAYSDYMGRDGATTWPTLLRPKSMGTIRLASQDPYVKPFIDPDYLQAPEVHCVIFTKTVHYFRFYPKMQIFEKKF
jgi:choline dehydrogenase